MQARYAAVREKAYQQGLAEAPELMQDLTFRDFVVLYIAEGSKRNRNIVEFVNSDPRMVKLAHRWMRHFSSSGMEYRLQYHVDQDVDELKTFWENLPGLPHENVKVQRKSNSGKLARMQFRSVYGVLTLRVGDTYLRARLEAWMDYIKSQW